MMRFTVDCNGSPACVESDVSGNDVVIVGSAVPMAWTRPLALAIAARGFRVMNFDYGPPTGWEGTPEPRTCVEQIDDVLAVMTSLSIKSAHVVGLSRGAITAFGVASRHPGRADSLILGLPV